MRKLLLFLFIPLLLGCNQESMDTFNKMEEPEIITETCMINLEDPDIQMFQHYNDSIAKVYADSTLYNLGDTQDSRSIKDAVNKIKIVLADVKGAYQGAKYGKSLGTKIVFAALGAIIASAIASLQISGVLPRVPAEASQFEVAEIRYANYVLTDDWETEENKWQLATGLVLDSKYDHLHELGKIHNVVLDMESVTPDLEYKTAFSEEDFNSIHSSEFQALIYKPRDWYNGTSNESPYSIVARDKPDQIMTLFMQACNNQATNLYNVNTLIKDYVGMVEKTSNITADDKEILVSSMIVATYSNELWKKYGVANF